jgi:hypothetical protein
VARINVNSHTISVHLAPFVIRIADTHDAELCDISAIPASHRPAASKLCRLLKAWPAIAAPRTGTGHRFACSRCFGRKRCRLNHHTLRRSYCLCRRQPVSSAVTSPACVIGLCQQQSVSSTSPRLKTSQTLHSTARASSRLNLQSSRQRRADQLHPARTLISRPSLRSALQSNKSSVYTAFLRTLVAREHPFDKRPPSAAAYHLALISQCSQPPVPPFHFRRHYPVS